MIFNLKVDTFLLELNDLLEGKLKLCDTNDIKPAKQIKILLYK